MNPFLTRYLVDWLTTQTMSHAEQAVAKEVRARLESGDLGSYDGVLFKNSVKSSGEAKRITSGGVDIGVVGATKQELVGIIDRMGTPKVTKGDSFKYYTGMLKGRRVVLCETGVGAEQADKGTRALLQVFRPARIMSVGFAAKLDASLKNGTFFIPDRLLTEDGTSLDLCELLVPNLPKLDDQNDDATGPDENSNVVGTKEQDAQATDPDTKNSNDSELSAFLQRFTSGSLISVDRDGIKGVEKKRFFAETGAVAIERKTWAVANVCRELNVPFLPLCVLYDLRDQPARREAVKVVNCGEHSMARLLGAFVGAATKQPGVALDVLKIKEESLDAAEKLAKALILILSASKAEKASDVSK